MTATDCAARLVVVLVAASGKCGRVSQGRTRLPCLVAPSLSRSGRAGQRQESDGAETGRSCSASVITARPMSTLLSMLVRPPAAKIMAMMTN